MTATGAATAAAAPATAELGSGVPGAPSGPVHLVILGTNDFHGAIDGVTIPGTGTPVGGAEWLAAYLAALRAEAPERTLLLDGGDLFQGTRASNTFEGRCTLALFNHLGYDAAAIGNHEFDYGPVGEHSVAHAPGDDPLGALKALTGAARFPFLTSNVFVKATGARPDWPNVKPWTIVERAGVKIGLIGFTTVTTPTTTMPPNVAGLEFRAPAESAAELLPEMRRAGAQIIVGVGHLGGQCTPGCTEVTEEIRALLDAFPEGTFAAFVLGHSHAGVRAVYRGTPVIESYAEGGALGRIDLEVDRATGGTKVLSVGPTYTLCRAVEPRGACGADSAGGEMVSGGLAPDASVTPLLEECRDLPCVPLAEVPAPLVRDRWKDSPLGSVIADLLREATPRADFAVMNSGGLRGDLAAGPLDDCGLYRVLPFDNAVVTVEMTGAEILTMLRLGASGTHGLLQVSGLRYGYEPCRTWTPADDLDGDGAEDAWELNRLTFATTDKGKKLDPKKTYEVVTNEFLVLGGDDLGAVFSKIPPARIHVDYDTKIRDAVIRALRARKGKPVKLAAPAGKPRVEKGAGEPDPGKWGAGGCR